MPRNTSREYPADYMHGDEAIKIFDTYREHPDIDDQTRIEDIDVEFPWLKRELGEACVSLVRLGENRAGTFKIRGALAGAEKLLQQYGALKTASAGNAARATALVAKMHDVPAKIMVPRNAPQQKREGIKKLWPDGPLEVKVVGENFDQTLDYTLNEDDDYGLLPPFNDPNVIAGQGTVVDAIGDSADIVVAPVGGGGLVAGIAKRAHERGLHLKIHPVEMEGSDTFSKSMAAGEVVPASRPNQLCGGSAVSELGGHALKICLDYRDMFTFDPDEALHTTSNAELFNFIDEYEQHRTDNWLENVAPYEPTTLAPMAKVVELAMKYPNKHIVVLGTGQNAPLRAPLKAQQKNRIVAGTFPR